MSQILVSGSFDDVRSRHMRFLQEAARVGPVHVLLWDDASCARLEGKPPKFPLAERKYFVEAIRYVDRVTACAGPNDVDSLPDVPDLAAATWVVAAAHDSPAKRAFCAQHKLGLRVIPTETLQGFPEEPLAIDAASNRKRVIVTGCYDWFHSGHVRFFEEVSALGDLYVCVGHDANIRLLKGEGHPLFPQAERRYVAGSIRYVKHALVTSGSGWLDAEPEIQLIRPHRYAVNDDGDKPEKRAYCEARGIEYCVLRRTPKEGLPRRQSTDLRGF